MRLHKSLALTFLTVFTIHCGLIYWLIDYKEKYAEASMYRLIKVKLSEKAPSNKTKATQESKSVSEKDFAEKTSINLGEQIFKRSLTVLALFNAFFSDAYILLLNILSIISISKSLPRSILYLHLSQTLTFPSLYLLS